MAYEPSDEEKRLAKLSEKDRDRHIEQALKLEQKYKDPATSDRDRERINLFLKLRQELADDFRECIRTKDPIIDDGQIVDAINRYGKAAAAYFHIEQPFESLATSYRANYDTFISQQSALSEKISNTSDPKEREILKITKLIEAHEYLSLTPGIAPARNKQIAGRGGNPESRGMTNAAREIMYARGYSDRAQDLRQQYQELQEERPHEKEFQARQASVQERNAALIKAQHFSERAKQQPDRTERPKDRDPDRDRER